MNTIILKNKTVKGEILEAKFTPDHGMNMLSFKKGSTEVIEQSTKNLFDERFSGLGPMIGPHFHRRNPAIVPKIEKEELFPHIQRVKEKGIQDPFSHGIARYAPWKVEAVDASFQAKLSGNDKWEGVPLSELQGENFNIDFNAQLKPNGLHLEFCMRSDSDSLVGIHYFYSLPEGKGKITANVRDYYYEQGTLKPIPSNWKYDNQGNLQFNLEQEADYGFHPYVDPTQCSILLETEKYSLNTTYKCCSEENSWQLYSPKGAPFVCIEPMSAQNPRKPILSVSTIHIHLEII